jgi:hypothetical protein
MAILALTKLFFNYRMDNVFLQPLKTRRDFYRVGIRIFNGFDGVAQGIEVFPEAFMHRLQRFCRMPALTTLHDRFQLRFAIDLFIPQGNHIIYQMTAVGQSEDLLAAKLGFFPGVNSYRSVSNARLLRCTCI